MSHLLAAAQDEMPCCWALTTRWTGGLLREHTAVAQDQIWLRAE